MSAPPALGGFIVACIVLAPEAVGAIKAAFNNQLQRAMNLYFGSVLATRTPPPGAGASCKPQAGSAAESGAARPSV